VTLCEVTPSVIVFSERPPSVVEIGRAGLITPVRVDTDANSSVADIVHEPADSTGVATDEFLHGGVACTRGATVQLGAPQVDTPALPIAQHDVALYASRGLPATVEAVADRDAAVVFSVCDDRRKTDTQSKCKSKERLHDISKDHSHHNLLVDYGQYSTYKIVSVNI